MENSKQKNKVFVHRDEGWVGAGALVTILINGKKQGTLGPGEMKIVWIWGSPKMDGYVADVGMLPTKLHAPM